MKRAWSHPIGHPGTGTRFSQALGCMSTETYVSSILDVHVLACQGIEVRITANRIKVHPVTGEKLEDYRETGDYIVTDYAFEPNVEGDETSWFVEREPNEEGEQSAADYATALGFRADRDFCEAMVHLKSAFDCFGGRGFIKPIVTEGQVVGIAYEYQHLVKDTPAPASNGASAKSGPHSDESSFSAATAEDSSFETPEDQGQEADSPDTASEDEEPDHSEADREQLEAIEARV